MPGLPLRAPSQASHARHLALGLARAAIGHVTAGGTGRGARLAGADAEASRSPA